MKSFDKTNKNNGRSERKKIKSNEEEKNWLNLIQLLKRIMIVKKITKHFLRKKKFSENLQMKQWMEQKI